MYPSPALPKPAPGVVTTFASLRRRSKNSQLSPFTPTQRYGVAEGGKRLLHDAAVLEVEVDRRLGLRLALGRIDRLSAALGNVARAVELSSLATRPHRPKLDRQTVLRIRDKSFGNNRIATTDTGEASSLRVAAELYSTATRAFALVDGMGNPGCPYECLVGGVEEDERLVSVRPVDPLLKLFLRGDRASRVVRIAEVYDVSTLGRFRARHKAV